MESREVSFEPVTTEDENPPIPEGCSYVKGNMRSGFVIQDNAGNQYVWVDAKKLMFPDEVCKNSESISKYGGYYAPMSGKASQQKRLAEFFR